MPCSDTVHASLCKLQTHIQSQLSTNKAFYVQGIQHCKVREVEEGPENFRIWPQNVF